MRKKQKSSKAQGRYERHDPLFFKAKREGFAARSIFKLEEIDKDFKLIKNKDNVLDLGCRPGSWMQYVDKKVALNGGKIVGIDLLEVEISFGQHVRVIQGDIYDVTSKDLMTDGHYFDVVLSDMAPNTTGIKSVDQDRSLALCERALEIAVDVLKPGGNFCVKTLEGGQTSDFIAACKKTFTKVKIRRPKGTRVGSRETYIVGLDKKS